jgi:hypothetical protein
LGSKGRIGDLMRRVDIDADPNETRSPDKRSAIRDGGCRGQAGPDTLAALRLPKLSRRAAQVGIDARLPASASAAIGAQYFRTKPQRHGTLSSTHPTDPCYGIALLPAQFNKRGMPMRAAFIERHGGPEVLKFGEMPDPVAVSGEVVVDIVAASVNGADWNVREGKSNQLARFP